MKKTFIVLLMGGMGACQAMPLANQVGSKNWQTQADHNAQAQRLPVASSVASSARFVSTKATMTSAPLSSAAPSSDAIAGIVIRLLHETRQIIHHPKMSDGQKKQALRGLLERDFAIKQLAFLVLPYQVRQVWSTTTEHQKQSYYNLFAENLVGAFFNLLKHNYTYQSQIGTPVVTQKSAALWEVECAAKNPEMQDPLRIKWYYQNGALWDMLINGASMKRAKTNEYAGVMRTALARNPSQDPANIWAVWLSALTKIVSPSGIPSASTVVPAKVPSTPVKS